MLSLQTREFMVTKGFSEDRPREAWFSHERRQWVSYKLLRYHFARIKVSLDEPVSEGEDWFYFETPPQPKSLSALYSEFDLSSNVPVVKLITI
jgi:hypothetical protein